jgi:hypothetical protein
MSRQGKVIEDVHHPADVHAKTLALLDCGFCGWNHHSVRPETSRIAIWVMR